MVVEVARFSLDCLQLVLATESADMVLVFSLLHTTNTDTTHNKYPLYCTLYLTDFLNSALKPLFLEMRLFLLSLTFSCFLNMTT